MPFARLLFPCLCAVLSLSACGGREISGGCGDGFAIRFAITSIKDGLPLDSLSLDIAVAGGQPQRFAVNLKTGVSSASITAAQGQAYALRFELFSAGHKIGTGEAKGNLDCDLDVALAPIWNEDSTKKAKEELGTGTLLPARLSLHFAQALSGADFTLPLDSLAGLRYRWIVKLDDTNLFEDEGSVVRFRIADSLAGRKLVLRLQVLSGNVIREERIWEISVLAVRAGDSPVRQLVRSDTAAKEGASLAYAYENGRLARVEFFDALAPPGGAKPVGVESLFYDGKNRLYRARALRSDGGEVDSLFAYDEAGSLAAVTVRQGASTVADSLFYEGGKLSASRRSVDGKTTETAKYRWTGTDIRVDSVFGDTGGGFALARVISNAYRGDSLVERRVAVMRARLEPYVRETFAYNGLGSLAWRELWLEGQRPSLERTDAYRYDGKGRLASILSRDEVLGESTFAGTFEYASPSTAGKPAPALAKGGGGAARIGGIVASVRFAHVGWDQSKKTGGLPSRKPGSR